MIHLKRSNRFLITNTLCFEFIANFIYANFDYYLHFRHSFRRRDSNAHLSIYTYVNIITGKMLRTSIVAAATVKNVIKKPTSIIISVECLCCATLCAYKGCEHIAYMHAYIRIQRRRRCSGVRNLL